MERREVTRVRADARVAAASLKAGQTAEWKAGPGRHQYLVAQTGRIRVNGVEAGARDGIATKDEGTLRVEALEDAEIVLVDSR